MYEFMQRTVVQTAFMVLIAIDIWWVWYLVRKLIMWIRKKNHKAVETE